MTFAVLVVSHLGYDGGIWLASVPGHCLPFTCVILNWHFICVFAIQIQCPPLLNASLLRILLDNVTVVFT